MITDAQTSEVTTSISTITTDVTTESTQAPTSSKVFSDVELSVVIAGTIAGFMLLFTVVGVCAWQFSNMNKKRSYMYQESMSTDSDYRPYKYDTRVNDIYLPYNAPAQFISPPLSPAAEPYTTLPAVSAFDPYMYDNNGYITEEGVAYPRADLGGWNSLTSGAIPRAWAHRKSTFYNYA